MSFWTQVIKYEKGTKTIVTTYPVSTFRTVTSAVRNYFRIKHYLYGNYDGDDSFDLYRQYSHDLYDWEVKCDQQTQLRVDQLEHL